MGPSLWERALVLLIPVSLAALLAVLIGVVALVGCGLAVLLIIGLL